MSVLSACRRWSIFSLNGQRLICPFFTGRLLLISCPESGQAKEDREEEADGRTDEGHMRAQPL